MSSLRNAIQRRNHRERAQPLERTKWGILEKSKDYKLRATDHKQKKRKIKALKEKAATRNEDEFYFAMMSATSHGGIKRAKRGEENSGGGGKALDSDVVKLLKTQDQGYMQTVLQKTRREREKLEEVVAMQEKGVNALPNSKRMKFDESGDIESVFTPSKSYDMDDDDDGDAMGDLVDLDGFDTEASSSEDDDARAEEGSDSGDVKLTSEERRAKQLKQRTLELSRKRLSALEMQEEKLSQALNQLEHQRAKMNGTIGSVNTKGVGFRVRHRKR